MPINILFKSSESSKFKMLILLVSLIVVPFKLIEAQVISHELRRLSVSTNQFGIDVLKALDRIEPPDKVLVFCPICLSSSLVMIMMGSSKYPVVSSLRQALYVWSMSPQEINKGFKDIFEHIGLNQQHPSNFTINLKSREDVNNFLEGEDIQESTRRRDWVKISQPITNELARDYRSSHAISEDRQDLSLPKLMRAKEYLEIVATNHNRPWWVHAKNKPKYSSRELKDINYGAPNHTFSKLSTGDSSETKVTASPRLYTKDSHELSQMSSTSNIYIQRGLIMNYNYNLLLRQHYKTVIHPVDFTRHAEETRQHINSIVASSTEGKVKDLVRRGTFEALKNTRVMMISTFHFRGTLDIQMKDKARPPEINEPQQVHIPHNEKVGKKSQFIETEEALVKHGTFPKFECSVLEIPFSNRLVSLVIILPTHQNSTEYVLTKLNARVLADMMAALDVKKVTIEIPIIKFDRGPVNVEGLLKELGLNDIFFGDKIHSTETGLNRWMVSSNIVHETSIDIGTINPKWNQPEDRLKVGAHSEAARISRAKERRLGNESHVRLDKSFFYFVLDSINGSILTMGRIRQ